MQPTPTAATDGLVFLSVSAHQARNYQIFSVPFDCVGQIIRGRVNYSATAFKDGYRDGNHALQGQVLIILDFDENYSIGEAMVDFEEYFGMIATTRNHMKEKHGVIAERFRVILPTDKPIMLDRRAFSMMMEQVMLQFKHADKACKNIDRMYFGYPEAEIYPLNGAHLFDWERYHQAALQQQARKQTSRSRKLLQPHAGNTMKRKYQTFFRTHFVPGNRNNALFQLTCWMRDDAVKDPEPLLRKMNDQSSYPLDDDEVTGILRIRQ